MVKELSVIELHQWLQDSARPNKPVLIDVREPWELELASLPQAKPMPMQEVPARIDELSLDRPIVCMCHHGGRSLQVANYLYSQGLPDVYNLTGGINAWSLHLDNSIPRY